MVLQQLRELYARPLTVRSLFDCPETSQLAPDQIAKFVPLGGNTPFHVPKSPHGHVDNADDPQLAKSLFVDAMDHVGAPIYVASFEECVVTCSGAVITRDGSIVLESLYPNIVTDYLDAFRNDFFVSDGVIKLTRNDLTVVDENVIHAREIGEYGYFHWVNSVLPRFHVINHARISSFDRIMVAQNTDFARQSLGSFLSTEAIVPLVGSHHYVRHLNFLSPWIVQNNHFTRPPEIRDFYQILKSKLGLSRSEPEDSIYISRNDAVVRRLSNEADVVAALKGVDCVVAELAGKEFRKQVELFHNVKLCIGVHGAGLSNIAFMQPGSTVVEIVAPDRLWPTYRSLAARMGVNYVCVVGKRNPFANSAPIGNQDILVDVDTLTDVITSVGRQVY